MCSVFITSYLLAFGVILLFLFNDITGACAVSPVFPASLCCRKKLLCICRGCIISCCRHQPQYPVTFLPHWEAGQQQDRFFLAGHGFHSNRKQKRGLALGNNVHARDYGCGERVRVEIHYCWDAEDRTYNGSGCIQAGAFRKSLSEQVKMFYLHTVCGTMVIKSNMKLHITDLE